MTPNFFGWTMAVAENVIGGKQIRLQIHLHGAFDFRLKIHDIVNRQNSILLSKVTLAGQMGGSTMPLVAIRRSSGHSKTVQLYGTQFPAARQFDEVDPCHQNHQPICPQLKPEEAAARAWSAESAFLPPSPARRTSDSSSCTQSYEAQLSP
jgi:hypothetical protein